MNIELRDVHYSYPGGREILAGVTVQFETGKSYAILGPSGSGKTTLLALLGGLDLPSQGTVRFGEDILNTQNLSRHRSEHVAFIFQNYNLIDYLTPLENVALTASPSAAAKALEEVGILEAETGRSVLKLSGGQQQRVAIARALACNKPVILADEPTGNLDEATSHEITQLLLQATGQGKCVIVVTHSIELAQQVDISYTLRNGILCKNENPGFEQATDGQKHGKS